MTEKTTIRCAIYTRKSTEPLDQEFNSLDAQRESAENYIKSQKINGWKLLPEHYDDGGFSGGNTERPALKRLMADIEAGKIDVIVLYKIDRLSRSILDFMNMAEFFEKHNVSFVSVTQDINTSTSSGRMMLNILMTFSEYERDVITERIRDKIAGAKRRGKFCGGGPVLGFDAKDKRLIVNNLESKIVKEAFTIYSKLGSGHEVARALNRKGYRTKQWTSKRGRRHTGRQFTPKGIYRILSNPLYIGKVQHNGNIYDGEQDAIIDMKLWDKVQYLLKENSRRDRGSHQNAIASPFKGLLTCGYCGGAFGITYTKKKNRRYMYYLCIKDNDRADHECPLRRLSAGDVDKIILKQLARIFRTPSMLVKLYDELRERESMHQKELLARKTELEAELQTVREQIRSGGDVVSLRPQFSDLEDQVNAVKNELASLGEIYSAHELTDACGSIERIWEALFPAERYKLAHQIIDKITLYNDHIVMDIKHNGLKSLIGELKADQDISVSQPEDSELIRLDIPVLVKRWNGRKLIITPNEDSAEPDLPEDEPSALAKRLAQAHQWTETLESGKYATIGQLADAVDCDSSKTQKILNLVNLSPELQKSIVSGNAPESMTLRKLYENIPEDWDEQKRQFDLKQEVSYV